MARANHIPVTVRRIRRIHVFISHTAVEAPVAFILKELLQSSFPGLVTVFASSDVHDETPGDNWFLKIEAALKKSSVMIVVCSPSSLTRPWINFEAGCAWVRKLSIIPACHSGQHKDQLPHPFSQKQGIQLEDHHCCEALVESFSQILQVNSPKPDLCGIHKRLLKAIKTIAALECSPQIISSERERTKQINDDLRLLLESSHVSQETVWTSAFLSTFAVGSDDPYPEEDQDYLKLLLQERELLLKLARKGCTIKCVISPANRNHIRYAGIDYSVKRTRRLLDLLEGRDQALKSIDWAIAEFGVKNLYVIGHISCFEGYKSGVHRGYGLTLRQTSREAIHANVSVNAGLFRDLAARTLLKWGNHADKGGERELLRMATVRCLRESLDFLSALSQEASR